MDRLYVLLIELNICGPWICIFCGVFKACDAALSRIAQAVAVKRTIAKWHVSHAECEFGEEQIRETLRNHVRRSAISAAGFTLGGLVWLALR